MTSVPLYRGRFGPAQAERLLCRAGFGPGPGAAPTLTRMGLRTAVLSLTRPGPGRLHEPLVERMTLVWHDWFGTSSADVGSQPLMLAQKRLFHRLALGTFEKLLLSVTKDPAMLVWLSGNQNTKDAPNDTYARELMARFTLGAGYNEQDVRDQARALTGWRNDVSPERGPYNFRFDPGLHDYGPKTIFGHTGDFDWKDSCRLCLEHASHPSFVVRKLWSYFVPTPPSAVTEAALEERYVSHGYAVRPVVEGILMHPQLYLGPSMANGGPLP